jgi:hypothetical protein
MTRLLVAIALAGFAFVGCYWSWAQRERQQHFNKANRFAHFYLERGDTIQADAFFAIQPDMHRISREATLYGIIGASFTLLSIAFLPRGHE